MIFDLERSAKVVSTHFFHNAHHGRIEYTSLCAIFCLNATMAQGALPSRSLKLWMMIGGTLLILGCGVRGQGQLWHSVLKTLVAQYLLQFLPNHFQTSHASCG